MYTGILYYYILVIFTLQKSYYEQSDLITLNTGHPKYEVLRNVLERVCDLVAFYELVAKVDSTTASTYLYPLLTATTNETCNWVGEKDELQCNHFGIVE